MSLHDYIFSEFYSLLTKSDSDGKLSIPLEKEWEESQFLDGAFMIVRGLVKIVDYEFAVEFLRSAPSLEKLMNRISSSTSGQTRGSKLNASQMANVPLKEISSLVEQFFKGSIRLKVFPYLTSPSKVFVGTAIRDLFRYNPSDLTNLYGPVIDASWVSVLMINRGTTYEAGELVSQTGNALEDSLEQMVDFAVKMGHAAQGVRFPAVAVTPIAIFREI